MNDLNVTEHERHVLNISICLIFLLVLHFSRLDVGVYFFFSFEKMFLSKANILMYESLYQGIFHVQSFLHKINPDN